MEIQYKNYEEDNWSNNLKRIIQNAVLMGFARKRSWWEKVFNTCNIGFTDDFFYHYNLDSTSHSNMRDSFFTYLEIFERHYGENYDVGINISESNIIYPYFKVLYKSFTISNSIDLKHTIKDLMLVHTFKYCKTQDCLIMRRILGTRLTFTPAEVLLGYSHSHLPSRKPGHNSYRGIEFKEVIDTSPFCVGIDSEINYLEAESKVAFDYMKFELYLHTLDNFVRWESLEGVPYVRIASVKNYGVDYVSSPSWTYVDKLIRSLKNRRIEADCYFHNHRLKIKSNYKFRDFIKGVAREILLPSELENVLCVKDSSGDSYININSRSSHRHKQVSTSTSVIWRGELKKYRMLNPNLKAKRTLAESDIIVHPDLTTKLIKQIETKYYEEKFRNSTITALSTNPHANRCFV